MWRTLCVRVHVHVERMFRHTQGTSERMSTLATTETESWVT